MFTNFCQSTKKAESRKPGPRHLVGLQHAIEPRQQFLSAVVWVHQDLTLQGWCRLLEISSGSTHGMSYKGKLYEMIWNDCILFIYIYIHMMYFIYYIYIYIFITMGGKLKDKHTTMSIALKKRPSTPLGCPSRNAIGRGQATHQVSTSHGTQNWALEIELFVKSADFLGVIFRCGIFGDVFLESNQLILQGNFGGDFGGIFSSYPF